MAWLRTIVLLPVLATAAGAADWPQWLGPGRNGSTTETVPVWKGKPEVVGRAAVGGGFSSPVVAGGRVFLRARGKDKDKEEEEVLALDAAGGKVLWRDTYARPPYKSVSGTGPRATPTLVNPALAGGRLYARDAKEVVCVRLRPKDE